MKQKLKSSSLGPSWANDLKPPQHLDGVDEPNIGVAEVVEGSKGEGREEPNAGLRDSRDESLAVEEAGPDVVDHDGLDA